MDPIAKTLMRVSKSMRVIEIGPSYNPMVPRSRGWNSFSLDHASRDELVAKYKNHPSVNIDQIEEVDFVWRGGPMESAVPEAQHGTFDACVASHVIEHVPDFIGFFKSMERLLSPGGLVCLVVPDKRYEFDFFKPLSTTGEVLQAHLDRRTRHVRRAIFDMAAYTITNDGEVAWMPGKPVSDPKFSVPDLKYAYEQVLHHSEQDSAEYVDAHTWYFTPSSFELIVLELGLLGVMDFTTDILIPTSDRFEFYVTLKRGAPAVPADGGAALRMELLTRTQRELAHQIATLAGGNGRGAETSQIEKRWQEKHRRLSARLKKLERRVGVREADKGHRRKGKTRRGKSNR